jgi:serine/threonine-protein kinase
MAVSNRINNRYEIRSTLGQGGMGVVYRAYDFVTKRDVAIKTMRDIADPAALELFAKEWTVLAGLSHPNIVDILDTGEYEENGRRKPYFVMPMLPGNTLDALIKNASQRLTVHRVVEILVQTCRGLQAAHERGLVHRDLKPSNIFVLEDDTAKIIDFGVVHLTGTHSVTGIKGTLQYMAPEQLELQPATTLSDIFSLGVVGYETLTGRKPFARQSEGDTAEAVRKFIPPPASEVNPAVSEVISRVIHKAMAKQPRHRFASAREFAETLTRALHNQTVESFDPVKIRPRIERARKAFNEGDLQFAAEILGELEAEGHIDPDMSLLRMQIDQAARKKNIRQLLESARTRFEQEEYPLALQKIQDVLRIEPDNADALGLKRDIEGHRSERQVDNWFRLVKEHIGRNAFTEAREGLDEILKINPKDTRALQLRSEVEQKEQDAIRVRNEKEQLYSAAKAAFQSGEISTALSRLERVLKLNREVPDRVVPERDSLYQGLYNQVRSEHDSIRMAYEEGRRALTEQDFTRALEICDQYLNKYPGQPLFQALKLEAGEQQRQQLSSFLAETGKRVDAEPDLDRKIAILKEAAEKHPGERQFQDALKLTRERRDLVNSIVARARQYEERAQYAEAIGQWEILRSIYTPYPGIGFEIAQLQKRRENQTQEEAKSRWTEQIDRAIEGGKFERALDLTGKAFEEFPNDAELSNLAALARQGVERSAEAQRLFEEGQKLCAGGRYEEGTERLRQAFEMDQNNPAIAQALANALVEEAREMVDTDWRPAERLVEQALVYDATNAAARSLRALIEDRKRREFVAEVVGRARQLQLEGKVEEALDEVDHALIECPAEQRLVQLQNTLRNALASSSRVQSRNYYLRQLHELTVRVAATADPQQLRAAVDQARGIASRFPEDAEMRTQAVQVEQQAMKQYTPSERKQPPTAPPPAQSYVAGSAVADPAVARTQAAPPPVPPIEAAETSALNAAPFHPASSASAVDESETTVLPVSAPTPHSPTPTPTPTPGPPAAPLPAAAPPPVQQGPPPARGGLPRMVWMAIALIPALVVLAGVVYMVRRPKPAPPAATVTQYSVTVQASQPGALIRIDGQTVEPGAVRLAAGAHTATAELDGYQPITTQFEAGPNAPPVHFDFLPAPQRVRISTGLDAGKAALDAAAEVDLQDGGFSDDNVSLTAAHKLRITGRAGQTLSVAFSSAVAKPAILDEPVKNPDEVAISTLGKEAVVYCGAPSCQAGLKDQPLQPVPAQGLDLHNLAPNSELVVTDGKNPHNFTIDSATAPVLAVYLTTNDNVGTLRITSNVPDAQVTLNGQAQKRALKDGQWSRKLAPGTWVVRVSKDGYLDAGEQHVDLAKGDTKALNFDLKPAAVNGKLVIDGAMANTEVWIDGLHAGTVSAAGSFSGDVGPGSHDVELRKDGFEDLTLARRSFSAGQTLHLSAGDVRMRALGVVNFQVMPPTAQVSYHRAGDAQTHAVRNNTAVPLPAGQYVVSASAPKREPREETVEVDSGKAVLVNWMLSSASASTPTSSQPVTGGSAFETPAAWQEQNGWWFHKGPSFAWLKSTRGAFNIDIARKGAGIFGAGGKIDWQIGFHDDRDRVAYQLDEHKLTRHAFANGNKFDHASNHSMKGDAYQLRIDIEPTKITVRDGSGNVLDEYVDASADFTAGKFGFKGDVRLVVR